MRKIILFLLLLLTVAFSQEGGWDGSSWYVPDTTSTDQLKTSGTVQFIPESVQQLNAGTQIVLDGMIILIEGNSGPVTLTGTPTIATTDNGVVIILTGNSDSDLVTLQDETSLNGSKLELSGDVNFTLGAGDVIWLRYTTSDAKWYEITRTDN